jgi:hypothetical protein
MQACSFAKPLTTRLSCISTRVQSYEAEQQARMSIVMTPFPGARCYPPKVYT